MSIQLSLIFAALVGEMAVLSVLVAPLPRVVRRKVVALADFLQAQVHVRVLVYVFGGLVTTMFVDTLRKAGPRRMLQVTPEGVQMPPLPPLPSLEAMALRFYAQRNMYLTGALMFSLVAILTVVTILRKLVALEKKTSGASSEAPTRAKDDPTEVAALTKQLAAKKTDLQVLRKQVAGYERAFDAKADTKAPPAGDKKRD